MDDSVGPRIEATAASGHAVASSQYLAAILAHATDAIFSTDREGTIVSWNQGAEHLLGWSEAEIVGRSVDVLAADTPLSPLIRETIAGPQRNELVLRASDGTDIDVDVTSAPVVDQRGQVVGVSAIARDIRGQRATALVLRQRVKLAALEAETSLAVIEGGPLDEVLGRCAQSVVDHVGAAFARIWTLDTAERVLLLKASAGIYTHRNGPHSRVPVGQFKIGLIAQTAQSYVTNEVVGDPRVHQQEWAIREGMIAFAGYPLLVAGRVVGVLAMFARHRLDERDREGLELAANLVALAIERARAEEERAALLASERHAREVAEEASRAKDLFLATLSHELRTPLNAITGWAHMLKTGSLDAPMQARAVETIERNARAQARLIEDLLDVSRIVSGKLRLDIAPLAFGAIVEAAVDAVRHAAEAKSVRLQVLLDPAADAAQGDATRLQQVIWNLLSNAIKFTPKGGRVQVRLSRLGSHLELTVSDTGNGIERAFLPYVFDRFRQSEMGSERVHGGLGLGLAIVRHIVEMHGGTITVDSAGQGQGSTFCVRLPVAVLHRPERTEPKAAVADDSAPALAGRRVLVLDDDDDSRDMLAALLTRCGLHVTTAATAAEALATLRAAPFDAVVSDIQMPGEDGYAFMRQLRASEHPGRAIPAVAVTGGAQSDERRLALLAGFQMHVGKPVDAAELLAVLTSLLNRR